MLKMRLPKANAPRATVNAPSVLKAQKVVAANGVNAVVAVVAVAHALPMAQWMAALTLPLPQP